MTIFVIIMNLFTMFVAMIKIGAYGALYGLVVGYEQMRNLVKKVIENLKKSKKSESEVTWINAD